MTNSPPPVPPESISDKGPGDSRTALKEQKIGSDYHTPSTQRGQQANIKQNITNQGHQQDR